MTRDAPPPQTDSGTALLERHDRERYLAAMGAPEEVRPALIALLGLNLELARIREVVREPLAGRIRLQWWRDTLTGSGPAPLEVVRVLRPAEPRLGVMIQAMIDGRERDLDDEPPVDLAELEAYAAATAGTLFQAMVLASGADDAASHEAARALGLAWAITGLTRAIPAAAAQGRRWIPDALMDQAGLTASAYESGRFNHPLGIVARCLSDTAHSHLVACRTLRQAVSPRAIPILGLARVCAAHLGRLTRAGYDPYAPGVAHPDDYAPLRLAWSRVTGRY
jgi:phytoene synthase